MDVQISRLVSFKWEKWKYGFNEEAKHGLIMNKIVKTTFGLGKEHCAKNILRIE